MLNPKAVRVKNQLNKVKKGESSTEGFPKTDYTKGFNEFIGIDKLANNDSQVKAKSGKSRQGKGPIEYKNPLGKYESPFVAGAKENTADVKFELYDIPELDTSELGGPRQAGGTDYLLTSEGVNAKKAKQSREQEKREEEESDAEYRFAGAAIRADKKTYNAYNKFGNYTAKIKAEAEAEAEEAAEIEANRTEEDVHSYVSYGASAAGAGIGSYTYKKKIIPFEKEIKEVTAKLKANGTIKKYDNSDITNLAKDLWKKNRIDSAVQEKATKYLQKQSNIDEAGRKLTERYSAAKGNKAAIEISKQSVVNEALAKSAEVATDKYNKLKESLKPSDYKFTTQEEVDAENEKIALVNAAQKEASDIILMTENGINKLNERKETLASAELEYDLLRRDYSQLGALKKLKLHTEKLVGSTFSFIDLLRENTLDAALGGVQSMAEDAGYEDASKFIGKYSGKDLREEASGVLGRAMKSVDDELSTGFAKETPVNDLSSFLYKMEDLVISQVPTLTLMALSGGTSAVAEKGFAGMMTSALKLEGLAPKLLAATSAGEKYSSMKNEMKYGYVDEEGNINYPQYNPIQMIAGSAIHGYGEGVGDSILGAILSRGGRVLKAAKARPDKLLDNIVKTNAFNILKKMPEAWAKVQVEEQGAEHFTNLIQNFNDRVVLGKDVSLLANTETVFKDTALMASLFGTAPHIAGAAISTMLPKEANLDLLINANKMQELATLINRDDISETEREVYKSKLAKLNQKSSNIVNKIVSKLDDISESSYKKIQGVAERMASLRSKAKEINASNSETKEGALNDLREEYLALDKRLNNTTSVLSNFEDITGRLSNKRKTLIYDEIVATLLTGTDGDINAIEREIENIYNEEGLLDAYKQAKNDPKGKFAKRAERDINRLTTAIEDLGVDIDVNIAESAEEVKGILESKGMSVDDDALISNGIYDTDKNGRDFIVINKQNIRNNGVFTTGQHELLHKVMNKAFLSNPDLAVHMGNSLWNAVDKYLDGDAKNTSIGRRLSTYQKNYDKSNRTAEDFAKYVEETMPLFSEALTTGEINYDDYSDFINFIRNIIYKMLGVENESNELLKLDTGEDVINFIKDYNKGYAKGKFSKAIKEFSKGNYTKVSEMDLADNGMFYRKPLTQKEKADRNRIERINAGRYSINYKDKSLSVEDRMDALDLALDNDEIDFDMYEAEMKKLEHEAENGTPIVEEKKPVIKAEKEKVTISEEDALKNVIRDNKATIASDKVQSIYDEKGLDGAFDIIKLFKPITAKIVDKRRDAPGFDKELLTDEIETGSGGIIDLIRTYKASSGTPLAAYINKNLPLRAIAASKRLLGESFSKDVEEQKGLMATETADQNMTTQVAEKPKYADALEAKILPDDVIATIKGKVLSTVRTLKSRIDEPVSINRTITPIISEIMAEMGTQADIDLKTAMGGKKNGELRKWLLSNKKYILENMTTTWLMGKGKANKVEGGIPNAIQKRVNGKWLSYPDWVGEKIDRESVNIDLAGRTAGHELVRRLPNVSNNVSDADFLSNILEPTGNPIRGRKESLAKAIAEELSIDLIKADLAAGGEIYDALVANQTRLGVDTSIALVNEFVKQGERGNSKYSLSAEQFKSILDNSNNIASELIKNNFSVKSIKSAINKYVSIDVDDNDAKAISKGLIKASFEKNNELKSKTVDIVSKSNAEMLALITDDTKKLAEADIVDIINKKAAGRVKLDSFRDNDGNITPVGKQVISTIKSELFTDAVKADPVMLDQAIKDFVDITNSIYRFAYNRNNGGKYKSNKDYIEKLFREDTELNKLAKNWSFEIGKNNDGNSVSYITRNGIIYKPYTFDVTLIDNKKDTLSKLSDVDSQSTRHSKLYSRIVNAFKINNQIEAGIAFVAAQNKHLRTNASLLAKFHGYESGVFAKDKIVWEHRPTRNEIAIESVQYLLDNRDVNDFKNFLSTAKVFAVSEDFNKELNKIALKEDNINKNAYDIIAKQLNKEIVDVNGVTLFSGVSTGQYSLSEDFNKILEETQGIKVNQQFSDITARIEGANKGRFRFFIPPSAEDFVGLLYDFMGKGKAGEAHAKFFKDNLLMPYIKGVGRMDHIRANIKEGYRALKAEYPEESKKLKTQVKDRDFTYDQAVRVYLWQTNGIDVPGLSAKEVTAMSNVVKKDKKLREFADRLSTASGQLNGWVEPTAYWNVESIVSDLHNATEKIGRRNILKEFISNSEEIFSTDNLNKIEVALGPSYRDALEDSLARMKNGSNRSSSDKFSSAWTNWIANANGVIMFFNTRSAILQTIAATNYINWSDNNVLAAGKAFLNQPQYWKDFSMIFNSDKLKERREGLKADVNEAELANAVKGSKNKAKAALSYLLKIGYTPTQMADSFAIAAGGATFYRNRVNTYLKQGFPQVDAEAKAFEDFDNVTEETQQSSDPSRLSQQQASTVGRLVLAFANAPMQYNRLMKKSFRDLINGRGDVKTHVSKILYYGAVQNIIFSALQNGIFAMLFDDDEEDEKAAAENAKKQDAKINDLLNDMTDTILRGSGIYGAIASTAKNVVMQYIAEEEKGIKGDQTKTFVAALGISPPIGSKAQKLHSVMRIRKSDADVIAKRGWGLTENGKLNPSPNYDIAGKLIAITTNFPADRVVDKVNNVAEMLDSRNKAWQRIALGLGWNSYSVGVINEEDDLIKAEGKKARAKEGAKKAQATRLANSIKKQEEKVRKLDSISKLPEDQIEQYYLNEEIKKQEEKVRKLDSISKLPDDQINAYYAEKENKKKAAALKRKIKKQFYK